jgi:hypothetical protein
MWRLGNSHWHCAVGPDYLRPSAPVPAVYKELKGWKRARCLATITTAAPGGPCSRTRSWTIWNRKSRSPIRSLPPPRPRTGYRSPSLRKRRRACFPPSLSITIRRDFTTGLRWPVAAEAFLPLAISTLSCLLQSALGGCPAGIARPVGQCFPADFAEVMGASG